MIHHKLLVMGTFFLGVVGILLLGAFLTQNWMNPVAVTVNLICSLVLVGAVATIWKVLEPKKIAQEQMSPPLQKFGESLTHTLGYRHPIVFVIDNQFNASASREFGLFGRRIVALGEAILATRDIEAIKFIVAHEITHLQYRDNFITAVSWLSGSWLENTVDALNPFSRTGPEQTTLVTLLARVLLFLVFLPLWAWLALVARSSSAISHDLEYRADRSGAMLSTSAGIDRTFGLIAYLHYFEREDNYELYRDRVARFLSWIPLPEQTVAKWIAESASSTSHPSVKTRLDAAKLVIPTRQPEVLVEDDFLDLCEERYKMLAGGAT